VRRREIVDLMQGIFNGDTPYEYCAKRSKIKGGIAKAIDSL